MDKRYFVIESGPVLTALDAVIAARAAAWDEIKAYCAEIGAQEVAVADSASDGYSRRVVSFIFSEPPGKGWRPENSGNGYKPDRRYKAGRQVIERLSELRIPGFSPVFDAAGIENRLLVEGRYVYWPQAGKVAGIWVLIVPCNMEHPYIPADGLRELMLPEWYELLAEHERQKAQEAA